jgi:uncharacterized membrane protein
MSAFVPLVFMVIVFKITFETRTQHIDREFGNQLKNKELLKKLLIAQIATVWALYIMACVPAHVFFISYYFLYHQRPEFAAGVLSRSTYIYCYRRRFWRLAQHVVGVFYC